MDKESDATDFFRKLTRGVTLLELLIVLVLVGITSGFAVSSWRKVMARSTARASMESLLVTLHRARSDATAKEKKAGVAISRDTSSSFEAAGAARQGLRYLRFIDVPTGTAGIYDTQDSVVQGWTTLEGQVFAFKLNSSGLSGGVASVVFNGDGSTDNDLRMDMGLANFTDTFHLSLLPATGLATLER